MPKPFPAEFRRDVIAVARKSEASIAQVAKDFGISESCLQRWLKIADREDGLEPPAASGDRGGGSKDEPRSCASCAGATSCWSRRTRSCGGRRPTSPATCSQMIYPLVRELAAGKIPVTVTCGVLGFSKHAYYAWCKQPVSQRDWDDAHLSNAAYDIHRDDPAFGYRFIADELRERVLHVGENWVARLCSQQRIWSVFAKKPGLNRKAGPPVHDDLVDRQFSATAPNLLWLTDITEHSTGEGTLYLCAIKDVYSGRIVGYSIDSRMKASLAVAALRHAIARRSPGGTVVHSDRGSQFRSNAFVRELANNGLVGSMGRVGACGDNAAMESWHALLQENVLDRNRWATRDELRLAIVDWIERTYHRRRRQRRLTPVEYETFTHAAEAA